MQDPDSGTNALEPADQWHELVLENALDAVIGIDATQTIIAWNKQAHTIFGWTKAEAMGRQLADLIIPPKYREQHHRGFAHFLETGEGPILHRRIEIEGQRRDGHLFPVELTVIPVRTHGTYQFYSFVRDLSELRQQEANVERAERALRASEKQLMLVTDALPALVAYINRDGTYRFANSTYEDWFRIPREKVIGRHVSEVLPSGFLERARPSVQRALAGESVRHENRLRRWDGSVIWVEVEYVPDVATNGTVLGYVVLSYDITDRKEAEETVKTSEVRFRTMFEQSPFSTQLLAPDGRTLQVNRAWEELWGISKEVIQSFILTKYNVLEDPQLAEKGLLPYLKRGFAGEPTRIPAALYDPIETTTDGRPRWVQAFIYPIRNLKNEIIQDVLIHEDVTIEVEARRAIRESDERFRLLVEGVQDYAISLLDPAGKVVSWNSGAERIHGYSAEEIIGQDFSVFYGQKDDDEGIPARHLHEASTQGRFAEEGWRVRKDGSRFWASVVVTSRRENGLLVGFSQITRDVTARKQADEEKQTLLSVLENSSDFIAVTDLAHRLTYVNHAARELLGDGLELGRTTLADFFSPEEFTRLQLEAHPTTLDQGRWEGEVEIRDRRDGSAIPALMNSFVIRSQSGDVIALASVSRNISELKRTQLSLEAAVRARDEFISICSHELKTPVTSVKLQFQSADRQIKRGDPSAFSPERTIKRVALVNRQMDRMSKLIDDMLDVARIATGRLELHLETLDLNEVVTEVTQRFAEQTQEAGIEVHLELAPEALQVHADPLRLEQVVTNLFTNAMKYGEGKPIRLTTARFGHIARLMVHDSGMGISPESQARIFDRYERAVSSQHISGLGLGLYISRQIVLAHGGIIRVESTPGDGATFVVELPAAGEGMGSPSSDPRSP